MKQRSAEILCIGTELLMGDIINTNAAYLAKDAYGEYKIPVVRQRPLLLMGAPGIGKTAIMEVNEEFGIKVHAIVTVEDIHEYLKQSEKYNNILPAMEDYMAKYCIL